MDGFQLVHINADHNSGEILRERRLILKMTQKQVAEKANISLVSYQRFENGDRNILTASFQLACRVIEALQMNISDFYHGTYVIGEEIYFSKEGLRYKKTDTFIEDDIT